MANAKVRMLVVSAGPGGACHPGDVLTVSAEHAALLVEQRAAVLVETLPDEIEQTVPSAPAEATAIEDTAFHGAKRGRRGR